MDGNAEILIISQNYKLIYKSILLDSEINNSAQSRTKKIGNIFSSNSLQLDNYNLGVLEMMSYLKWGGDWTDKESDQVYNYQNNTPLNGVFLRQYLKENGHEAVLVENFQNEKKKIENCLRNGTKYVVISTTFITDFQPLIEICDYVKNVASSAVTIVGGPLIHQLFDTDNAIWQLKVKELLKHLCGKIDYYIVEKKGEKTLIRLIRKLKEKSCINDIKNLVFYSASGETNVLEKEEENGTIDDVFIDYADIENISDKKYLSLITSRGCVFKCNFCTYHETFPKVEYKSFEILKKELDSIPKAYNGKRMIRLADDNFAISRKRLGQFCRLVTDNGYDFNWSCFASHHSMVNSENVRMMADSGCKMAFIGIESASQNILDNMNKKVSVRDFYTVIENLNRYGIISIGSFVVGFPGETEATIEENIDFIDNSGLTFYQLNLFHIFPATQVYHDRYRWGLKGFMYEWMHKSMDSVKAAESIVHIIDSVTNSLTGGMADTSIQGSLEYLFSLGLNGSDIIPLFKFYTQMLKRRIADKSDMPVTEYKEFEKFRDHYWSIKHKICDCK
jgi:anaerobic magnesium-protoporphyrin IX monomethyl ester cyclase